MTAWKQRVGVTTTTGAGTTGAKSAAIESNSASRSFESLVELIITPYAMPIFSKILLSFSESVPAVKGLTI